MAPMPRTERLAQAGLASSLLVFIAGGVALVSAGSGVEIASVLLTVAAIVAAAGLAAARDPERRVNIGIWIPIVAALPLFGIFYAIGLFLFRHLGQTFAGALLIAVAAILGVMSLFATVHRRTPLQR
jgi:hypothetical protein